jgi:hypothetical protein
MGRVKPFLTFRQLAEEAWDKIAQQRDTTCSIFFKLLKKAFQMRNSQPLVGGYL